MMLMTPPGSDDHFGKPHKTDFLSVIHRGACVLGVLITVCCLFRCYLSVANALQDVHKFEHTNNVQYFLYFLDEYQFTDAVCMFMLMLVELTLYVVQFRSVSHERPLWGNVCYFTLVMMLHITLWVHVNSIPSPEWPYTETADAVFSYILFANMTVLPSVVYLVSYILRVIKNKPRTNK